MKTLVRPPGRLVWPALAVALVLLASLSRPGSQAVPTAGAVSCPAGYSRYADLQARELESAYGKQGAALAGLYDHLGADLCVADKHPESYAELNRAFIENENEILAPTGAVKPGALKSAIAQQDAMEKERPQAREYGLGWKKYGNGPLNGDVQPYNVAALGNGDVSGRIADFDYVEQTHTLYAAVANGGVWMSRDHAKTWKSIGDSLPTQVIGSVAFSPANGGTLIALSGDNSFGHISWEGFGAYYSRNNGRTWIHSRGVPDEAFGFKVTVDPTNPKEIYAATGAGLFRSTNAGASFTNVKLPTGHCAGKSNRVKPCLLANIVTDVIVEYPGGITEEAGGTVVAAVGWRAGNYANPDGTIQSPGNGLYISDSGAPGSFTKASQSGFAPQDAIGRVELGTAYGPDQDHNYLYAMVQDAQALQGNGPFGATEGVPADAPYPTVLQGVYASSDFGQTWTLMAHATEFQNPASGSALAGPLTAAGGFGPGVQAWYNMWIQPDPTRADPALGIPTRLLLGLEEVWQNELPVPQNGKSTFKVIGRYFAGSTCLFLDLSGTLPLPICPTDREDALEANTTTHPDQHQGIFIPDDSGGVELVVGNDGGAYTQTVASGEEFNNSGWGNGSNMGFNTLLPYHAVISGDGTVWMGLQDNGTAKIDPKDKYRHIMTFGGDGFFVAVDPDDSKIAFSETPGADMRATTDGGVTWSGIAPDITNAQFSHQFVMDPINPKHLITSGRQVVETLSGAGTGASDWKEVFNLGTHNHPADASAEATPDIGKDPANKMTSLDAFDEAIYVGFCGPCDVLNATTPFKNGIATNIGGAKPAQIGSANGWHIARAKGLPNRYITGVAIDPKDHRTVFVTLGGYSRRWTPPGMLDKPSRVGKGHVYMSTNAGNSFHDISANLPDIRYNWIELRDNDIFLASDIGTYAKKRNAKRWSILGTGLPAAPVMSLELSPRDKNLLVAATQGRGVYVYRLGPPKPYRLGSTGQTFPPPGPIKGKVLAGPFGFEVDEEGWTTESFGGNADALATQWRRQPPGNGSSTGFAASPYLDVSAALLTSPRLTHPGGTVELSWFERRDTEPGFDYMAIDWSSDGKLWNNVLAEAGQNPDFPAFSLTSVKFWAPKGALYVRFRLTSDANISSPPYTGNVLDDVTLKI